LSIICSKIAKLVARTVSASGLAGLVSTSEAKSSIETLEISIQFQTVGLPALKMPGD